MQVLQEHSPAPQPRRKRPSPCSDICMCVQRSEVNFAAITASPMEAVCVRFLNLLLIYAKALWNDFKDCPCLSLLVSVDRNLNLHRFFATAAANAAYRARFKIVAPHCQAAMLTTNQRTVCDVDAQPPSF